MYSLRTMGDFLVSSCRFDGDVPLILFIVGRLGSSRLSAWPGGATQQGFGHKTKVAWSNSS